MTVIRAGDIMVTKTDLGLIPYPQSALYGLEEADINHIFTQIQTQWSQVLRQCLEDVN